MNIVSAALVLALQTQKHDPAQKAGEFRKNQVNRSAGQLEASVRAKISAVDARFSRMESLVKAAYPNPLATTLSYSILPFPDNDVLQGLPSYYIRWGHQAFFYDEGRGHWSLEDVSFVMEQVINGVPELALTKIRRPNALGTERQVAKLAGSQVFTLPVASDRRPEGEEWFEYTPNTYVPGTKASMVVVSPTNESIFIRCNLNQYFDFMKTLAQDDYNAEIAQLAASSSPNKSWEQTVKKTLETRLATIEGFRNASTKEQLSATLKLWHNNVNPNQLDNRNDFAKEISPTIGGYNLVTIRKIKPSSSDPTSPQFITLRWDYDLGVAYAKRFNTAMTEKFDYSALHQMLGH